MQKKVTIAVGRLSGGGAERVATVWANELVKRGYEVSLLVGFRVDDEYEVNSKINIYSTSRNNTDFLQLSYVQRIVKMRRILIKIAPHYIISFLPKMQVYMMLASAGTGIKRIETIRVNPWKVTGLNIILKKIWKLCYRTSYKIILQTEDQAPFFSKYNQKKCVVIPNPISEKYINNYKNNQEEKVTKFIAVGRLNYQKNYEMMIKAFSNVSKDIPYLQLHIFGTGTNEYTEKLKTMIKQENAEQNVFLMGRSLKIEKEYKKNDVFLMSSDFEGLPNALMEAMASKLVCICTDCKTGPRDLIKSGNNGVLVPVGDMEGFAEAIRLSINMTKSQRENMAESARNKIMSYCSLERCTDLLCKIL